MRKKNKTRYKVCQDEQNERQNSKQIKQNGQGRDKTTERKNDAGKQR